MIDNIKIDKKAESSTKKSGSSTINANVLSLSDFSSSPSSFDNGTVQNDKNISSDDNSDNTENNKENSRENSKENNNSNNTADIKNSGSPPLPLNLPLGPAPSFSFSAKPVDWLQQGMELRTFKILLFKIFSFKIFSLCFILHCVSTYLQT